MKALGRNIEPVDVMVAVGLLATVMAGLLLFLSTGGSVQAGGFLFTATTPGSLGPTSEMEWVQPVLGQAIVENDLLERKAMADTTAAAAALNRATMAGHQLENSNGYLERLKTGFAALQADQAARVQFVMGRFITEFTARGVRKGIFLTEPGASAYNRRIIGVAQATQARMQTAFRDNWEATLGQAIVTATLDHLQGMERIQQGIGRSIVGVLTVQEGYREARAHAQEQLASVALASLHSEQMAERFNSLASDLTIGQPMPMTVPRSWPEIPLGLLVAASMLLIGVFGAALVIPTREEAIAETGMKEEVTVAAYRKTG